MSDSKQTTIKTMALASTLLFVPILFVPLTMNFFLPNKQLVIMLSAITLLTISVVSMIRTKKLRYTSSAVNAPLIAFNILLLINAYMIQGNRVEVMVNKVLLYIALSTTIGIAISENKSKSNQEIFTSTLSVLGTVLSIHSILQATVISKLSNIPAWLQNPQLTLTGSLTSTMAILVITMVASLTWAITNKKLTTKIMLFASSSVQLISLVLYTVLILQKKIALTVLPLKAGWLVALEGMKSLKTFLIGIGLDQFHIFYRLTKPLYINQTNLWNLIPTFSTNTFLHILTTTGVIGLSVFVWLLVSTTKLLNKSDISLPIKASFYTLLLSLLLVPPTVSVMTVLFVFIGFIASQSDKKEYLVTTSNKLPLLLSVVPLSITALSANYFLKSYISQYHMRQAQIAIQNQQEFKKIYDHSVSAIKLFPYTSNYHISLSQLNLSMASQISKKGDSLSDQDKKDIANLVQQAVTEGKIATQIQPADSSTWYNLANIYRNLINVAQNADQLATNYYAQAIKLDPANPNLHIEFGGMLFQLAKSTPTDKQQDQTKKQNLLTQALQEFQTAVNLKPDHPNAYYNLSKVFEEAKDYTNAYKAMQQTLNLLNPNSPDYATVQSELKALEEKLPKQQQQQSNQQPTDQQTKQISKPSPLPSPIPGGPIEIPNDNELNKESSATPTTAK